MTRNEKLALAAGVWFFFFRKRDATPARTPHPVGLPSSSIVNPDGTETPLRPRQESSASFGPGDDDVSPIETHDLPTHGIIPD